MIKFEEIKESYPFNGAISSIYREKSTDVLYIVTENGGITPMINPSDGLPLTYTKWKNNYRTI